MKAEVYGTSGKGKLAVTFPCEKGLDTEIFSQRVVDSDMGWGEVLFLTTSSELAHFVAHKINESSEEMKRCLQGREDFDTLFTLLEAEKDSMKAVDYEQLYDGDEIELDDGGFNFACCDCGLVHNFGIAIEDNGKIGIAFQRDLELTNKRREEKHEFTQAE